MISFENIFLYKIAVQLNVNKKIFIPKHYRWQFIKGDMKKTFRFRYLPSTGATVQVSIIATIAHILSSEQCSMSISFLLLLHSFCFRLALLAAKKPCWIGRIAKKLLSGRLFFWGWSQNQELKFSLVALFST